MLGKIDSYCQNYGFTKDKNMVQLSHALSSMKPSGIEVDIYSCGTYMLLLRASERNPVVKLTKSQLTVCKENNTSIANILLEEIDNCISKWYNGTHLEMLMSICGLCYQMLVTFEKSS